MLGLNHATIGYRGNIVYENASMQVRDGCIQGLIAPNGYGKTTLMRVLAGELAALKRGSVRVGRIECVRDFSRKDVLYLPGDASLLYGRLTVRDHLRQADVLWGPAPLERVAEEWGLSPFLNKRVNALSQGMKQQVTLALASIARPRYLLLDEPMNALDPLNVDRASRIFSEFAQGGMGILISSHILGNLDKLCSTAYFIERKQLVEHSLDEGAETLFARCSASASQ